MPSGDAALRVAVVRLPRISNFTDVDALGLEPDLDVVFGSPGRSPTPTWWCCPARAPSPIWPGCAPAGWTGRWPTPRRDRCSGSAAASRCWAARPHPRRRGATGEVDGLGLLDVGPARPPQGVALPVAGYEIHRGEITREDRGEDDSSAEPAQATSSARCGTAAWRATRSAAAFLAESLGPWSRPASASAPPATPDSTVLGDLVERHLDVEALLGLALTAHRPVCLSCRPEGAVMRVLLLGGTSEARELAGLAGRTTGST